MDTEIGTCLPIHAVFFVSLKGSLDTDRFKIEYCSLFEKFLSTCVIDTERVQLVKESVSKLIYAPRIDVSYSFTASG